MGKPGKCNINKIFLIFPIVVVLVAYSVFSIVRFTQKKNLEKAFNSSQYEEFRVVMSQEITDVSEKEDEKSETRSLDDAYILEKRGKIYYEEGFNGKNYYYSRNGQNYISYFDDNYGRGDGNWTEMVNDGSFSPMFDISLLDKIDLTSLERKGKYYVPISTTANDVFFTLWKILRKDDYSDVSIKFSIEDSKIKEITADYIFGGKQKFKDIYTFSYDGIKIEVPLADVF